MQTTRQEYRNFFTTHFKGLRLQQPLFYHWDIGLRFDLQVGKANTDPYFEEVVNRATTIFQSVFGPSDKMYIVFSDYKYRRRKIRISNFIFRQINNLRREEIHFSIEKGHGVPGDKNCLRNRALCKVTVDRVNYNTIITAIAHTDFPPRQPRLDQEGVFTAKEVYFVHIDKKLIFHMYDDRGLDIIAADRETIRPIYDKHRNWLLDHDREKMEKLFE